MIKIGVMGCSNFALEKMLPAVQSFPQIKICAIASRDYEKSKAAAHKFSCIALAGYDDLLDLKDIDAIYMPLPTGLHYQWAKKCLNAGKNLLIEKSLGRNLVESKELIDLAFKRDLVILENFLFLRHSQLSWVKKYIEGSAMRGMKFFNAAFTIPALDRSNFRYKTELGGGAMLDLGAYMVKAQSVIIGGNSTLVSAAIFHSRSKGVDIQGAASYINSEGVMTRFIWGFDLSYQCSWEFIGSTARLFCGRAFTPPPNYQPPISIQTSNEAGEILLPHDNHYENQWNYFLRLIADEDSRRRELYETLRQAEAMQLLADCADNFYIS